MQNSFFATDVTYEILFFLTFEEILTVGSTCKAFHRQVRDNRLWKMLCLLRIAPIQAPQSPKQWTDNILTRLSLENHFNVFSVFKDCTLNPLQTCWTETPSEGEGYLDVITDGGNHIIRAGSLAGFLQGDYTLLFGRVDSEGYLEQEFSGNMTCELEFNTKIRKFQRKRNTAFMRTADSSTAPKWDPANIIEFIGDKVVECSFEKSKNINLRNDLPLVMKKIYSAVPADATLASISMLSPSPSPSPSPSLPPVPAALALTESKNNEDLMQGVCPGLLMNRASFTSPVTKTSSTVDNSLPSHDNSLPSHFSKILQIQGLCTGEYGGHGTEILHCGITRNDPSSSSKDYINLLDDHEYYLRGLKIQGDPNVPGWQMSWAIRISNLVDVQEVLLSDEREILQFDSIVGGRFMDKNERAHLIELCFTGHGQINRHPGLWAPQWENVLCIVYKRPLSAAESRTNEDGVMFSVVFCPDDIDFIHIIDYKSLPNRQYFQKDWSLVEPAKYQHILKSSAW